MHLRIIYYISAYTWTSLEYIVCSFYYTWYKKEWQGNTEMTTVISQLRKCRSPKWPYIKCNILQLHSSHFPRNVTTVRYRAAEANFRCNWWWKRLSLDSFHAHSSKYMPQIKQLKETSESPFLIVITFRSRSVNFHPFCSAKINCWTILSKRWKTRIYGCSFCFFSLFSAHFEF